MTDEPARASFLRRHRPAYERALVATLVAGTLLAVAGILANFVDFLATGVYGVWAFAAGLVLLGLSVELGYPIRTLRTIGLDRTMGQEYDRFKRWPIFKTACVTLNLLTVVAAVALAIGLGARTHLLDLRDAFGTFSRAAAVVAAVLALTLAFTFHTSLRTPQRKTPARSPLAAAFFQILLLGSLAFAAAAALLTRRPLQVGGLTLQDGDVPFLVLAALTGLSIALFASRPLITIYTLFTEERDAARTAYESRNKSVALPITLAFALLFLVLLLALVFQIGLDRLLHEVPTNAFLLASLAFIVFALAASVWVSLFMARSEDKPQLYRLRMGESAKRERALLLTAGGLALTFLVLTALAALHVPLGSYHVPQRRWVDFLCFAILAAAGPYGFHYANRLGRIRRLEERFPDFLRDIAASRKAGLTLPAAVTIAARGEYGDLTPEIRKMADHLSLNVPFEEALARFGQRVSTPLVQRAVLLINEAGHTGGQVTDVLQAAAIDAREIKTLENERRSTMMLYTIIIYIIFGVFLFVSSVLYGTFIPEFLKSTHAALAQGATSAGGLVVQAQSKDTYRSFYFLASLVQAVGNGFIAGLVGTGKALAGLRHSFLMVLLTYLIFAAFLH